MTPPHHASILHSEALAKFLHQPGILKVSRSNLRLSVEAIQSLDIEKDPARIAVGVQAVLDYLACENPYLLSYRCGLDESRDMQAGLSELPPLARWAQDAGHTMHLIPTRRVTLAGCDTEQVQIRQGMFEGWM